MQQPIEEYFKKPSYQEVLAQLQSLNETDLAQQIEIIKGSFYATVVRNTAAEPNQLTDIADLSQIPPLTSEQLLQEATRIATEIQQRAIWGTYYELIITNSERTTYPAGISKALIF